jgi:hypothetical protein
MACLSAPKREGDPKDTVTMQRMGPVDGHAMACTAQLKHETTWQAAANAYIES